MSRVAEAVLRISMMKEPCLTYKQVYLRIFRMAGCYLLSCWSDISRRYCNRNTKCQCFSTQLSTAVHRQCQHDWFDNGFLKTTFIIRIVLQQFWFVFVEITKQTICYVLNCWTQHLEDRAKLSLSAFHHSKIIRYAVLSCVMQFSELSLKWSNLSVLFLSERYLLLFDSQFS